MVRSIPQLESLHEDWNELAGRFRSPLLDHDWFMSCAEAFHDGEDLRVVTVRRGSTLAAVAPLVSERTPSGRRLMLLGASRLYEPSGWLYRDTDALQELAHLTVRVGDPVVLQRVPADSPLIGVVRALPRALSLVRGTSTSLAVVVRSTFDDYYSGLSTHITANLRRLRRKAEKTLGKAQVDSSTPKPSEVDDLLEQVVKVEGSGWKSRAGSSLASRPDLRDFFRRYGHRAAARQCLHVKILRFGGEPAAVELSVEAHRRMWQLKIGYNDAVAAYYPGLQLTAHSIRDTFERQLDAYEFLGSAATWEERWRPDERSYRMLAVYPFNPRGVMTGCRDLAGLVWRRAQTVAARGVRRSA